MVKAVDNKPRIPKRELLLQAKEKLEKQKFFKKIEYNQSILGENSAKADEVSFITSESFLLNKELMRLDKELEKICKEYNSFVERECIAQRAMDLLNN